MNGDLIDLQLRYMEKKAHGYQNLAEGEDDESALRAIMDELSPTSSPIRGEYTSPQPSLPQRRTEGARLYYGDRSDRPARLVHPQAAEREQRLYYPDKSDRGPLERLLKMHDRGGVRLHHPAEISSDGCRLLKPCDLEAEGSTGSSKNTVTNTTQSSSAAGAHSNTRAGSPAPHRSRLVDQLASAERLQHPPVRGEERLI